MAIRIYKAIQADVGWKTSDMRTLVSLFAMAVSIYLVLALLRA